MSREEQGILLKNTGNLDESLIIKIRHARHLGKSICLVLSLDEYEDLLAGLQQLVNDSAAPNGQRDDLEMLYTWLQQKHPHNISKEHSSDVNLATSPIGNLETLLADHDFGSLEEVNQFLKVTMDQHNRQPDPEMGGLSPEQVGCLIYAADWCDKSGPLKLNSHLSLADLKEARFFTNVRIFLQNLQVSDGPTATANGNLNRKCIALMLDKMSWPEGFLKDLHRYSKVVNETDAWPLHIIRTVCECAKLVCRRKRNFLVTKKAQQLLADDYASELYAALFKGFFRQFNLAYLDRLPECSGLQSTLAYTFYRLGIAATTWQTPAYLYKHVLL